MLSSSTTIKSAEQQSFFPHASSRQTRPPHTEQPLTQATTSPLASSSSSSKTESSLITPPLNTHSFDSPAHFNELATTVTTPKTEFAMSNQLSGQQQHRRHQQHQLRQQHEIDDLDLDIDIDIDNDNDNAVSIDDDAASTGSIGPPPVTYMANMIANHLMPQGASMFGRREDASCILRVGQTRFYVHVQMLASRSPTFRRIFDDMIRNEAWGASSDTASSSESMAVYEDGQYDSDDESMQERQSFESNPAEQGDMRSHASHESQTTVQQSSDDLLSSMVTENLQLRSSEHDSNNLSIDVRRSLQSRDEHGSGQDSGDDLDDIDDSLPELTVALEDPDGDHFKELLYWLYTGDSERWLQSFTPENYQFILRNIVHLSIITRQVFNICLSYETTTSPDQGLRGMAMATLRVLPDDDYSTQITNL